MEVAAPPACSASPSAAMASWSTTTYLAKPYSWLTYISRGYSTIRHPLTRWVWDGRPKMPTVMSDYSERMKQENKAKEAACKLCVVFVSNGMYSAYPSVDLLTALIVSPSHEQACLVL